jgi:DNA polymerase-1
MDMDDSVTWDELPLTPKHSATLVDASISPKTTKNAGIYSITEVGGLPDCYLYLGESAVPALAFPWTNRAGAVTIQLRPDVPVGDDLQKYLWPKGAGSVLNVIRPVTAETTHVIIVEGTKQGWAVATYAGPKYAIYGIGGCRNWYTDGLPLNDLSVVKGKNALVLLDADMGTNLDVYTAAVQLGETCEAFAASSVNFVKVPAAGNNGIDDVLAAQPVDERVDFLEHQLSRAVAKPAKSKPKAKSKKATAVNARAVAAEADYTRPMVYLDDDRRLVINRLSELMLARFNATRLFNHGEVLSRLTTGRRLEQDAPVMRQMTNGVFIDLIQDVARTMRMGTDGPEYTNIDLFTLQALMSRTDTYAPLDRISRVPFVRKDGSICQTPGYDPDSRTFLALDQTLGDIDVPEDPTDEDVQQALKLITEEWLVDSLRDMPDAASKANALALVITPYIRGMVAVAPLAVVDGLQMGVGKNLFADIAVAIPATGKPLEPLPWSDDDKENGKVITAAFREGADVFVFDEAHKIHGASLARALTSATWKDRQLGLSQMLGFPNQVTWISLGNAVQLVGDVARRAYRIALKPNHPAPQNRTSADFTHDDPRGWVQRRRGEIVQAVLTIIRAWFAAGQPRAPKPVSFGSFEQWERIVGGILHHAGIQGFLENMEEWRSQTSFSMKHWTVHFQWLLETFGHGVVFTAAQVTNAMRKDDHSEPPPDMTDIPNDAPSSKGYNRALGSAYFGQVDRVYGGIKLVKAEGTKHGHVSGYMVLGPDGPDDEGPGDVDGSGPDDGDGPNVTPSPDSYQSGPIVTGSEEGDGGTGGTQTTYAYGEKSFVGTGGSQEKTFSPKGSATSAPPAPPSQNAKETDQTGNNFPDPVENGQRLNELVRTDPCRDLREKLGGGAAQGDLFDSVDPTPITPAKEYAALALPWTTQVEGNPLPEGYISFDIESTSERIWPIDPAFIRITGVHRGNEITVTGDGAEVADLLRNATMIIGHNIMSFDLVAFAVHHGVDLHELVEQGRVWDTMLTEAVTTPPPARTKQGEIIKQLGLDALATKKGIGGKTDGVKALAARYSDKTKKADKEKDFAAIPVDAKDYVTYCANDVEVTTRLARTQKQTDYAKREHRIAYLAARIRMNGFRVDVPLLQDRLAANEVERKKRVGELVDRYGVPLTKKNGSLAASPLATAAGKEAVRVAYAELGVELDKTPSGEPAFGKEKRDEIIEMYQHRDDVMELTETVGALLGIRSVYGTVDDYRDGDRVHPEITMFQSSGRWSITKPGLTVMGKRGGKYVEREIFLPEEGHVIITADLSQVDARAVAAWCQDEAYMGLFATDPITGKSRDSHNEIATAVWGEMEPGPDGKHPRREEAKVLGHGWNYGMGVTKLAKKIGSEEVARQFDSRMKSAYRGLVDWKTEVAALADDKDVAYLDNGWGRRLRPSRPRWDEDRGKWIYYGWTQGPALMGQSAARDILMEGLLRMPVEIHPYLRAVVHDEIVLSVPEDQADRIGQMVAEAMSFEWAPREDFKKVLIEGEPGKPGTSWGACYAK